MDTLLNGIWAFMDSGVGFAVIWIGAFALTFLFINKLSPFNKAWEKYEGAIITAIKLAEKSIIDDSPNTGLRRLDEALQFVLKSYADQNNGKLPSPDLIREMKEGIQIKHAELERTGNLRPRKSDL